MDKNPDIEIRVGPIGPRASFIGGPDVREIVRAVRSARAAEPELDRRAVTALVASNTGLSPRLIDAALSYWASDPGDIDAWIAKADALEAHIAKSP